MQLLCDRCNGAFDKADIDYADLLYYEYLTRECKCGGNLNEIDEMILPVIIELNKKGYKTNYCCSGHPYENHISTYISFEVGIELQDVHEEFYASCSIDNKNHVMHCDYDFEFEDYYSKLNDLLEINKGLYEWAVSLPYRDVVGGY